MCNWLTLLAMCSYFQYCCLQQNKAPCDWKISVIEEAQEADSLEENIKPAYERIARTANQNRNRSENQEIPQVNATTVQLPKPRPTMPEGEGAPQADAVTGPSLHLHEMKHLDPNSARTLQTNITSTTIATIDSAPDQSSSSSTSSRFITRNVSNISLRTARRSLQLLPADHIGNISGLIFLRPDLSAFSLQLQLELRCADAAVRQRQLRRLLAQRQPPQLSVSGDSTTAGPTEMLLQALPVLREEEGKEKQDAVFVAPLPLLCARLSVQTIQGPDIAATRLHLNFATEPGDASGGGVAAENPPEVALDLSCLGARARSFIIRSQATRLARQQRVRILPPLYISAPPTAADPSPGEIPPPTVLSGYRYLVQLVQTQFLELEQQQNATYDHLASPMQRMCQRANLVDGAARFFYFTQPNRVYVPADTYEKLIPESDGAGVSSLPPAVYLDRRDQLQFGFSVPGAVSARLAAEPGGLVEAGVKCSAARDGWRRCTASVKPLSAALDRQQRPGEGLRWASVSLDIHGSKNNTTSSTANKSGDCERHPPAPLRVAVGCPPSTTLVFNFTSTFEAAGLAEKCPRCLCDRGVPCLLYSDVFQPRLVLVDWTTYRSRNFTGNYTMTVLGAGYSPESVPRDIGQGSLAERIWAPSVRDETADIPAELIENPVFPHPLLNGIKWHCGQYSACPPFVRLRFSNAAVDSGTFCEYELELVLHLYGAPTNTFVDVMTMSAVFGVTLVVSLVYTAALTVRRQRVGSKRGEIVDLYPAH